jgi:hypothetical protein
VPSRKVDERKTRKALRKVRRAIDAAAEEGGVPLSDWEQEFARSVEQRLSTYGSAFRDAAKGALEEPLSARQAAKLSEIGRKARGKGGAGLRRSAMKRSSIKSTHKEVTAESAQDAGVGDASSPTERNRKGKSRRPALRGRTPTPGGAGTP